MTPFHFQTATSRAGHERSVIISAGIPTKEELLRFLKIAIPLPEYFGNNWDALNECLEDLEWLPDQNLALIHHDVPMSALPLEQKTYLETLAGCARTNPHLQIIFPERDRDFIDRLLCAGSGI